EIGPLLRAAEAVAAFGTAGGAVGRDAAAACTAAGWLVTGFALISDASGGMTTVRIFLGSVDALAACLPGSFSATGSSCFDTIRSLSAPPERSCATLLDCGSPALAGTIFVGVELSAVITGGGCVELG